MLKGFEKYTENLTEYEKKVMLGLFIVSMRAKVGKDSAIKSGKIVQDLKDRDIARGESKYAKVNEQRVKKVLSYIRINNLVPGLMATQDGYFVAATQADLEGYISSLTSRVNAINALIETAIKNHASMGGRLF